MINYNKYGNKKTIVDGIKFDSIKEANRYQELKLLARGGLVNELELQPRFELQTGFTRKGKKIRKIEYVADFRYVNENGIEIIEDVKGMLTDIYRLKRKLFLYKYPYLEFNEV